MRDVVIVEACRTAIGSFGGTIKDITAEELARIVVQGVLDRSGIDPKEINEVILGHCRQSSDNPNVARLVALRCGIPEEVPACTVMRQCASAMTAVVSGVQSIQVGDNDVVIAGGTESMSTGIFYLRNPRFGLGTGNITMYDSVTEAQFQAQPQETYGSFNMGVTADNVAERMSIAREDVDKYALRSQERAARAIAEGRFKDEIVPVAVPQRKADPIVFETDEFPRLSSLEKLAKLPPVFTKEGVTTAGNASGRNDGAAAVIIMSAEKAEELGLKPLARFISSAATGVDPRVMGLGPIEATRKALKRAGMTLDQIELIELNEAFAAQAIGCIRELGLNEEITNVNGGAVALGHPIGSSGCRIIVTLLHEMRKRGNRYGLATLCIAGGMGQAMIIEALY